MLEILPNEVHYAVDMHASLTCRILVITFVAIKIMTVD